MPALTRSLTETGNRVRAAFRPALMIELVEAFNPGTVARLIARYAAMSYECFFLSRGALRPAADFDAARDQAVDGEEYIANFLFLPAARRDHLRTLLPFADGRQ